VATARDGALFVSDDGGDVIWRVSYTGVNSTSTKTDKQ
jgi:glucose/arabinose dehydrogenase